jgi:hypothetical protein
MTREELQAVVRACLDAPRTAPGREDTIMCAAEAYADGKARRAVLAAATANDTGESA